MIKAVIFDFDDTLYDYTTTNNYALNNLFKMMETHSKIRCEVIRKAYEKINNTIKNSNNPVNKFNKSIYIKRLVEELKIPLHNISVYLQKYNDEFFEKIELYQGVLNFFSFLKEQNIKIAILSNNHFLQQWNKIEHLEIATYIDVIQTSDECGEEKPNKQIFLELQHKLNIPFEKIVYIGDNYECDIEPALHLGMFPFWFQANIAEEIRIENNFISFSNFCKLKIFFEEYFNTTNDFIFLSKYFGQSELNVQGPGGNISIKMENILFIKSSGCILGNVSYDEGFCLLDNKRCTDMVKENQNQVMKTKMYGYKYPSMESYFHSFMKKYTVHLHFTLSNIWLCKNDNFELNNFKYKYKVVDYFTPGIELASEIYKLYHEEYDIYFLKNHGVIFTSNSITQLIEYFEYTFHYFNEKLGNIFEREFTSFKINEIYHSNKLNKIVKHVNFPIEIFETMIFCFPDMAVFIQKMGVFEKIDDLKTNFREYDIILLNKCVYLIADTITKMYSLIEILDSYKTLYMTNKGLLKSIHNVHFLQNMEEEKIRKI